VSELPDGVIAIDLETTSKSDGTSRYRAEWARDGNTYRIRRIRCELWKDDRLRTFCESRSSGFRNVGEHAVPNRIVCIMGPATDNKVAVREWKSDDIGMKAPTDSDFVVKVPGGTFLIGLGASPAEGEGDFNLQGPVGVERPSSK
jgi:hypothetical protein